MIELPVSRCGSKNAAHPSTHAGPMMRMGRAGGDHLARSDDQQVAGPHPVVPAADRELTVALVDEHERDEIMRVRAHGSGMTLPRQLGQPRGVDRREPGLRRERVHRRAVDLPAGPSGQRAPASTRSPDDRCIIGQDCPSPSLQRKGFTGLRQRQIVV